MESPVIELPTVESEFDKWDMRFLALAAHVGQWSKDPSTKVGAVIVRPNRTIVSLGYNGFARGVDDAAQRLNERELKYQLTVHAEINAILTAGENLNGCTLYVTPLFTCSNCAAAIVQSGISRVVAVCDDEKSRWHVSCGLAEMQFQEAGVKFEKMDLKKYLRYVEF